MGLLKKIEKKLENAVEGLFAKGFKSKVEPVELGKKVALAMMNNKIVALKKVWAPNDFVISLSPADNKEYDSYKTELGHELQDFLIEEATAERLSMIGRPKINFKEDKNLSKGQFKIDVKISEDLKKEISETKDGATQLIPLVIEEQKEAKHFIQLQPNMLQYDLKEGKTLLGRSTANDIVVADPSLSRHHMQFFLSGDEAILKDLDSTNGISVNGKSVKSAVLKDKDVIEAGETKIVYRRSNA